MRAHIYTGGKRRAVRHRSLGCIFIRRCYVYTGERELKPDFNRSNFKFAMSRHSPRALFFTAAAAAALLFETAVDATSPPCDLHFLVARLYPARVCCSLDFYRLYNWGEGGGENGIYQIG